MRLSGMVCAVVLVLSGISRAAEMDFTPRYMKVEMEGVTEERAYFLLGRIRYIFFLPDILRLTGSPTEAVFTLEDTPTAVIRFSKSPVTPDELELNIPNLPAYRTEAEKMFWSGATNIRLVEERIDPYPINGWKSHEFTFTFEVPGEQMQRSVTFLNFNETQQWVITVTSRVADFKKMRGLANMILNSLHGVEEPTEENPPAS